MATASFSLDRFRASDRLQPHAHQPLHIATSQVKFLGLMRLKNHCVALPVPASKSTAAQLLIWNPTLLSPGLIDSIRQLMAETKAERLVLLSPSDWHHFYLLDWQREFPDATLYLPSERPMAKRPGVNGVVVDASSPQIPGLGDAIEVIPVQGCLQPSLERDARWRKEGRRELLVWHRASKTLLIGDMFHCHDRVSLPMKMMGLRRGFSYNAPGFRVGDRSAFQQVIEKVFALDVQAAITCHASALATGEVVEELKAALVAAGHG